MLKLLLYIATLIIFLLGILFSPRVDKKKLKKKFKIGK